jgi:hypothetical protein
MRRSALRALIIARRRAFRQQRPPQSNFRIAAQKSLHLGTPLLPEIPEPPEFSYCFPFPN